MHGVYAYDLLIGHAEGLVCVYLDLKKNSDVFHLDFTSPFNATVVDLLQDAGAQIIGKTNCDEFGMGYLPHSNNAKRISDQVT
jgi:hypothetical protein